MRKENIHNKYKGCAFGRGFTLIELSLSLVFISILSLSVVLVIANAVSAYHKSITLNQVDTVGSNLVDDMQTAIQDSVANNLVALCDRLGNSDGGTAKRECVEDGARKFVSVNATAAVKMGNSGETIENTPVYGAFCTGSYSYIWNSGYFFNDNIEVGSGGVVKAAELKYYNSNKEIKEIKDFRLLKVKDNTRAVCTAAIRVAGDRVEDTYNRSTSIGSVFDITLAGLVANGETVSINEEPSELLATGESVDDSGLALYDMSTFISEQPSLKKNVYYYTSFILGTVQGGINITGDGNYCSTPESYDGVANFDYCAINKFNFAALATGGQK